MKRNIFFVGLMLLVITASFYFGISPKTDHKPSFIVTEEVSILRSPEKISFETRSDNFYSSSYADPLNHAFKIAKQEDPVLEAKVKQWHEINKELKRLNDEYTQVVQLYSGYSQSAISALLQLNDSTLAASLHNLVLTLEQESELQLAIARIKAIEIERNKLNDYLLALKIKSTVPYFENAISYSADEATQFEALMQKTQGFLAD